MFIEGILYDMTRARLGEHYEKYALCKNCDHVLKHHGESKKCFFSSTTFAPIRKKEDETNPINSD
jgi:hypothetical protein